MGKKRILLYALAIGIVNALVFKAFEFIVNEGSVFIWDDIFDTDNHRWAVVPLAIFLSIGLTGLFRLSRRTRIDEPEINSVEAIESGQPSTLGAIGIIAAIGISSLLAGASLGPEASLMVISAGLGTWVGTRAKLGAGTRLLVLASVGALLVAFFDSLIPLLLPLLLLKKRKQLNLFTGITAVAASLTAFATLWLIDSGHAGYGRIPISTGASWADLPVALVVGFCAAGFGWLLKGAITRLAKLTHKLNTSLPWAAAAIVFGAILGVLYLLGGETIQFSGSQGSTLLLEHTPQYGIWALIGIIVAKLLATGWSLAAGYRGGLVFPSIFIGVAFSLIAQDLLHVAGNGALVGSIAGMLAALTGPPAALIFMTSILPIKMAGAAIAGIAGAYAGNRLIDASISYRRAA